nr:uracil-DNA glycosylase family protein [Bordetella parapertussis]
MAGQRMAQVAGFAALARADARVLVLGSMPGVASLRAQQYYGHPRNAFWPIAAELFGLDAAIVADSVRPNDFQAFFAAHPGIACVGLNGAAAATLYRRHVLPRLHGLAHLRYVALPSTSPAHAAMDFAAKLRAWRAIAPASSDPSACLSP